VGAACPLGCHPSLALALEDYLLSHHAALSPRQLLAAWRNLGAIAAKAEAAEAAAALRQQQRALSSSSSGGGKQQQLTGSIMLGPVAAAAQQPSSAVWSMQLSSYDQKALDYLQQHTAKGSPAVGGEEGWRAQLRAEVEARLARHVVHMAPEQLAALLAGR
jgi:hypothetical protein